MNVPGALALLGPHIILSDDAAREIQRTVQSKEGIVASLDAEIAQASAALSLLLKQRNEKQSYLATSRAPSAAEAKAIAEVILQKEKVLEQLHQKVMDAQAMLTDLIDARKMAEEDELQLKSAVTKNSLENVHAYNPLFEQLDTGIGRCQMVIKRLMQDRDEVHISLEAQRALLSPIRRLPTEVLAEIFLCCLHDDELVEPTPQTPPLLLANVCSIWRSVAHATPKLWCSISINLFEKSCTPNVSLIELWVKRSGSCPLAFRIASKGEYHRSEGANSTAASILAIFIPHYVRWRKICLEYQDWRTETGILDIPEGSSFPLLESVYLDRGYWTEQAELGRISKMMSLAPRLYSMNWTSQKAFTSLTFPWAQLTHYCLGQLIHLGDCLDIIRHCPNLCVGNFSLLMPYSMNGMTAPTNHVVNQSIRSLDIYVEGNIGALFDNLTLPSLKDIAIVMKHDVFLALPHHGRCWSQPQFKSLVSRSKCSIETMKLSESDILPEELIECLMETSMSLRALLLANDIMKHASVTDAVLQLLTCRVTQPSPLCPKLTRLKLWGSMMSSDGMLAEMVESRWDSYINPTLLRLDSLFVMLEESSHAKDLARLETLNRKRSGISVIRV